MTTAVRENSTLRWLRNEARAFPATILFGGSWVIVFILMVLSTLVSGPLPSLNTLLVGSLPTGHAFGDLTLNELMRGEVWRLVTCNFVHYNLMHIGMNLYGLYQLGSLLESWYGSGQVVGIFLIIGAGGNLVSAMARLLLGNYGGMHSGGGSVVVLGLVGLCAVMGWRTKSRIGNELRRQMVGVLVFTAIIGLMVPMIDNWGHAGGALVGGLIGFANRSLVRSARGPRTWWVGCLGVLIAIGCAVAQARDAWIEGRYRDELRRSETLLQTEQRRMFELVRVGIFYQVASVRSEFEHSNLVALRVWHPKPSTGPRRGTSAQGPNSFQLGPLDIPLSDLRTTQVGFLSFLESERGVLGKPPNDATFNRLILRLARVLETPPSTWSKAAFSFDLRTILDRASSELTRLQKERERVKQRAGID